MASSINAITTGSGGVITTADNSGDLNIQSGGSTKIAVTSSGVAVTGTLTVNGASVSSRSGVTAVNLSSGTPNGTLTSASNQLVVISATADGCSVTMPDMTTVSPVGVGYFTLFNTSNYPVSVKDSSGTIREVLSANQTTTLNLKDNSTATGVWEFTNPIQAGSYSSSLPIGVSSISQTAIIPVTSTQFVFLNSNTAIPSVISARLGTINTTTRAITYGSPITVQTLSLNNYVSALTGTSDRVSRGFIAVSEWSVAAQSAAVSYYGFAIVSNALYISTQQIGIQTGATVSLNAVKPVCVDYLGANNSFFLGSVSFNNNSTVTNGLDFRQFTVNVSGTTVTITNATGNGSLTASQAYGYCGMIGRTGQTSYVYDTVSGAAFSTGGYVSCNTATNTLTKGNRTSQTTAMMFGLEIPLVGYFLGASLNGSSSYTNNSAPTTNSFVSNPTGSRTFNAGIVSAITNAGTATVTASIATDTTFKSFASPVYSVLPNTGYPLPGTSQVVGVNLYSRVPMTGFSVSSSNFTVVNQGYLYSFDPTSSTFNINSAVITGSSVGKLYDPILFSADTLLLPLTANNTYDFGPVATPIKS
jgi:hypothetical protein